MHVCFFYIYVYLFRNAEKHNLNSPFTHPSISRGILREEGFMGWMGKGGGGCDELKLPPYLTAPQSHLAR